MNLDPDYYPHPSKRMAVYAQNGMVATSQPLAAQAGLDILRRGGNAIDAAIATAACLTVVEPTSNGIGGDAFALIWSGDKLYGLNASGRAPKALDASLLAKQGHREVPRFGWAAVTVPGIPSAWAELAGKFGRLPLLRSLASAIRYAENGYPLSPVLSRYWQEAFMAYKQALRDDMFCPWFNTFAPDGRAPRAGEIWRSPDLALTLQKLAESNCRSFYEGELAEKVVHFSQKTGGFLTLSDLAEYRPEWVQPININYRGYEVWEIPPNGHGIVALMALNILDQLDFPRLRPEENYHLAIEALKLAYADGKAHIAEPSAMRVGLSELLSPSYALERSRLIGNLALEPAPGTPPRGGTVYLATADKEGNMVSYIQSNYLGFGSGLVVPDTGIALHNRGCNFSLDPGHPNVLQPGKRPYHTIIPGFLTQKGRALGPFGVMGGFMQPQGHLQVILNTLDFGLNPQAALDAPRWLWVDGKTVEIEHGISEALAEALMRRGHHIVRSLNSGSFGRGQIIWRNTQGVLQGGSEPRADGLVAAY